MESDFEEWLRLCNLYLKFYKTDLPENVKVATFKRCLDANVDMFCALAIDLGTNKPVRLANYLKHLNTWSVADTVYLNDLYVDETSRLKGVGRNLIDYVTFRADEMGNPEVYWLTDMNNHRAQMLFTNTGRFSGQIVYKRKLS